MRVRTFASTGTLVLLAATAACRLAAEPHSKETCDSIRMEQETIVAAGVKADMSRGPEWAKANLAADKLRQIERFIEIEEQLAFRCGLFKARVTLPPEEEPTEAPAKAPPKAKPKPKASKAPAAAPAAKAGGAGAAPADAVATTAPGEASPPADSSAKPKAKARPQADDAFRPPPPPPEPATGPAALPPAPKGT